MQESEFSFSDKILSKTGSRNFGTQCVSANLSKHKTVGISKKKKQITRKKKKKVKMGPETT